jgi:hypothetical protein
MAWVALYIYLVVLVLGLAASVVVAGALSKEGEDDERAQVVAAVAVFWPLVVAFLPFVLVAAAVLAGLFSLGQLMRKRFGDSERAKDGTTT